MATDSGISPMGVPQCEWCASTNLVREVRQRETALCASCRNIVRQQQHSAKAGDRYKCAVYRECERLAKSVGSKYRLRMDEPSGLELEYTLCEIARLACGDECYRNSASCFNQEFTGQQRKAIIDLLFQIIWRAETRRRFRKAAYSPNL